MSAFAVVAHPSPARLACDQQRAAGHWASRDGIARVPCDPRLRERRDPLAPASLRPGFTRLWRPLQRGTASAPRVCRAGHSW